MKNRIILSLTPMLLLLFLFAACGSQSANSGTLADSQASNQATATKVHSGGCYSREDSVRSDGDYDPRTDYRGQGVSDDAPYLEALFDSCTNTISMNIHATPDYHGGTDFYQIRWARPELAEQQFSTGTRSAKLTNAHFDTIYSLIIQGCSSHWYGSDCSPWSIRVYVATYAPGACHPGYVWRGAGPNDAVCVLPATRDLAAYDNSQRYNRVDPNGAYGPDSCKQGYVWRAGFPGDAVCVLPATRSQVAYDNSQAAQRKYS